MTIRDAIADFLDDQIRASAFSGAQAAWHCCNTTQQLCAGKVHNDGPLVTSRTRFDIASLTKPFVASAALRLVDQKTIALQDSLDKFLSPLRGRSTGAATLEQLLAHEAGFIAWEPFFERPGDIVEQVFAAPSNPPGIQTVYSDLGFISLGCLLEEVTGLTLDQVVKTEVIEPLGLDDVCYKPTEGAFAATQRCPWREKLLVGEVHDDNAWKMGGIAGHAGLFATAAQVAKFGACWLQALDGEGFISKELAHKATACRPLGRALGWDLKSEQGSSAGTLMSPQSFGHLGFTGCSLWIDPEKKTSVALLTNRVYYGRENTRIRKTRIQFHDLLMEKLLEKMS